LAGSVTGAARMGVSKVWRLASGVILALMPHEMPRAEHVCAVMMYSTICGASENERYPDLA
jgi:hypothetical protein